MILIIVSITIITTITDSTAQIPGENEFQDIGPVGNTGVVHDREWATSPEEKLMHEIFLNYTKINLDDNQWNRDMLKENIRNYNLETAIGVNVDGYELSVLFAQLEKIEGTYAPTNAINKLHEWAFIHYDVPTDKEKVLERIAEITKTQDLSTVKQLVNSTNIMINYGNVDSDIYKMDTEFWAKIGNGVFCKLEENCNTSIFDTEINTVGSITKIVTYLSYRSTIFMEYEPCATSGKACNIMRGFTSTGSNKFVEAGPSHVQDESIFISMMAWTDNADAGTGDIVIVNGRISGPVVGSSLHGYANDGWIIKSGDLHNPNSRAESQAWIEFVSYAYRK